MWHRLKNFFLSLQSYNALSPDLRVRRRVNQKLQNRPALTPEEWFTTFYEAKGVAYPIVVFAYTYLEVYSGLKFSRTLPDDRLLEDLQWSMVCWFDWQVNLCDDFWQCLQIDLSNHIHELPLTTVEELVFFLHCQWISQKLEDGGRVGE